MVRNIKHRRDYGMLVTLLCINELFHLKLIRLVVVPLLAFISISLPAGVSIAAETAIGHWQPVSELSVTMSNPLRNRRSNDATVTITIENKSSSTEIAGPFRLVLGNLTSSSVVSIGNATGMTDSGEPYIDLTAYLPSNVVAGYKSASITISVAGGRNVFSFTPRVEQWRLIEIPPLSVKITSPASLLTVGSSPVMVQGAVSDTSANLFVNGAAVPHGDGTFTAQVALSEGYNVVQARAIASDNTEVTDSVSIVLDTTPPYVTIESHQDGDKVYTDKITVTGLINDIVHGTVTEGEAAVVVNNKSAQISNRSYSATDIPLQEGPNTITVTGSDHVGNIGSASIVVYREKPLGKQLKISSGQDQSAAINATLPEPLKVRLVDGNGQALAGQKVVFRVTQGSGLVSDNVGKEDRALAIDTDANGYASVQLKTGSRVGSSNQKVKASVVGVEGDVIFNASATARLGNKITLNAGNNQRGAVGQQLPQPLVVFVSDEGANAVQGARVKFVVAAGGGQFSNAQQSMEVLTDNDGYAFVEYNLGSSTGVDAQRITATLLDTDVTEPLVAGFTATAFVPGNPGNTKISGVVLTNQEKPLPGVTMRVEGVNRQAVADANGQFVISEAPVGPVHLIADGSTATLPGEYPTLSFNIVTVAGVNNPLYQPIHMVKLTETDKAYAGLKDVAITMKDFPGFKLEIPKGSVTFPGGAREGYVSVTSVNANSVPMTPPNGSQPQFVITVQPSGARFDPPARITIPNVDGLAPGTQTEMYSYDHDLEEFVAIGLGTVSDDGSVVKSNPGVGIIKAGWFAAQPPGGDGDVEGDPNADPNDPNDPNNPPKEPGFFDKLGDFINDAIDGLKSCVSGGPCSPIDSAKDFARDVLDKAGEAYNDLAGKVADTVEGAKDLANEAFDKAGEVVDYLQDKAQEAADPIVMATGELHFAQTDMKIPGRGFDFELKRTYRSRIHFNGRVGYNWVFNYYQLLQIPTPGAANQNIVRVMEDGRHFTYVRNPNGSYQTPDSLFDVLTKHADGTFTLRRPDGFKTRFTAQGQMSAQEDRFGNRMEFVYDQQDRLVKVIDTLGREIVFSYRIDSGHIDTVTDFAGRSVRYTYDSHRDLIAVRTPVVTGTPNGNDFANGKYTFFTYSSGFNTQDAKLKHANHNLLTVKDAQGNVYLKNTYNNDPNSYEFDRITKQQFGTEAQVFQLSYQKLNANVAEITPNLAVNRTTMIDRNGNRHEYEHNYGGMLLEQRIYSNRNVNPGDPDVFVTRKTYDKDGLLLTSTNPEGDSISYEYDTGNPLRYMQHNLLKSAHTPGVRGASSPQLIEQFSYEPVYNQLRSVTNRRSFSTVNTFDYQHSANQAALATELGVSQAELNNLLTTAGMTLEGGVSGQIGGNVVRVDSPKATLPDGSKQTVYKTFKYSRFGQLIEQTDAEGLVTQYEYYGEKDPDGDGNLSNSSRTLANDTGGYRKAEIQDARVDSRRTRPGPALAIRTETVYDAVGNPVQVKDGRGNVTRYIRNSLNQVVRKIDPAPLEYLTDYYYDANNNLVRVSRQNVGTTGSNLSGFVHTINRYNLLNDKTAEIKIPATGQFLETKYEYDANQNLRAVQQPEGNRVERIYDERNLVHKITRGAGTNIASTRTLHYDANGNLLREVDAADNDGDGKNEETKFSYDGYNRLLQTLDAAANRVVYGYDDNGNKIAERHYGKSGIGGIDNEILLAETAVKFDELDRPYQRDDSLLVNGQPQNVGSGLTPDDNKVTGINWHDANGLIVKTVDDNGNTSLSVYDGLNRRSEVTDANGNRAVSQYDANGNVTQLARTEVSVEDRVNDKTITQRFGYDVLNRKTSSTDALGNVSTYRYDSRNNLIESVDPLGNIVLNIHDGMDRLLESRRYLAVDGVGATGALDNTNPTNRDGYIATRNAYDKNSRLISQTDDNGNVTRYGYDVLNRRDTTTYADGSKSIVVYDADDNVVSKTDPNGSLFSYRYDSVERLTESSVVPVAGVVGSTRWTYSYDGLSRRLGATDNNDPALDSDDATVEYRYDSLNRVLSETNNGLKASASYDGLGNRQTLAYPGGRQLNYQYDKQYNLKAINDNGKAVAEYDYAGRRVLERRYANGSKLNYINVDGDAANRDSGYDGVNRVVRQQHTSQNGALLAGFAYAYDKADNRRYEIDRFSQLADVYEYDSVYRVVRAAYRVAANDGRLKALVNNESVNSDVAGISAANDTSYILDGVGNWSSKQTVHNQRSDAVGYQTNALNQYTRIGPTEQSYDANGNLTHDGKRKFLYDALNRLVRVATLNTNTLAVYKYDAFGRRVEKKAGSETVRFLHFGKQVLEERDPFNLLKRQYVYGNRVDEVLQLRNAANQDYYYHDNSIGSIAAISNAQGEVVERYRYNAYGETEIRSGDGGTLRNTSAVGNNYAFTGRYFDAETGFYYYRARFYAPERGRFLQRDPLGYADGMGVYAYVGNKPVNFVDPEGLYAKEAWNDGKEWVSDVSNKTGELLDTIYGNSDLINSDQSGGEGLPSGVATGAPGVGLDIGADHYSTRGVQPDGTWYDAETGKTYKENYRGNQYRSAESVNEAKATALKNTASGIALDVLGKGFTALDVISSGVSYYKNPNTQNEFGLATSLIGAGGTIVGSAPVAVGAGSMGLGMALGDLTGTSDLIGYGIARTFGGLTHQETIDAFRDMKMDNP